MADLRPQYIEEAVGANHPTKADVINRAYNVEHDEDGTHGNITTTLNLISGQIAFPATAIPSADVNTLDDYEEGFWTPEPADAASGGNAGSATVAVGEYTKIGRMVTVSFRLVNIDTTGLTAGNDFYIRDLPFPLNNVVDRIGAVRVADVTFVEFVSIQATLSTDAFRLVESASGAAVDFVIVSQVSDDAADVYGSLVYSV